MAQEQVLEHEVLARAHPGQDGREEQPEQFEHASQHRRSTPARGFAAARPLHAHRFHLILQVTMTEGHSIKQVEHVGQRSLPPVS